jgi:hypothetical protein
MPGSPVFHGYAGSRNPNIGVGGAARVETSSLNAGNPSDMTFFIWVAIIGIVVPLALMGGLQFGKFQFVFRR